MAHVKPLNAIIKRRLPQILGVYIAGLWLCVEIADWMSERFDILPNFSTYVFIVLLCMVPAVLVIAWGHGQPGKDEWTWGQSLIVTVNLVLALILAIYMGSPTPSTTLSETNLGLSINPQKNTGPGGYLSLE